MGADGLDLVFVFGLDAIVIVVVLFIIIIDGHDLLLGLGQATSLCWFSFFDLVVVVVVGCIQGDLSGPIASIRLVGRTACGGGPAPAARHHGHIVGSSVDDGECSGKCL